MKMKMEFLIDYEEYHNKGHEEYLKILEDMLCNQENIHLELVEIKIN